MISRIAPALSATLALSAGFLVLTGAKSCGSASSSSNDGEDAICKKADDCHGLPHIECVGDWSCDNGQCAWDCEQPKPDPIPEKCTGDAECPGGWCDFTECVGDACEGVCRDTKPDPEPTVCEADSDCGDGFYCELTCAAGGAAKPAYSDEDGDGAADAIWYPQPCTGQCVEKQPEPTECNWDGDCGKGYHCEALCNYSGGEAPSEPSSDGGSGADFAPAPPPCPGQCVKDSEPTECYSDDECGSGYRCQSWCDGGVPVPMGEGDSESPDGDFKAMPAPCGGQCVKLEEPIQCNGDQDCPYGTTCQCTADPSCPMCDVCFFQCVPKDPEPETCGNGEVCPDGATCECMSDPSCPMCDVCFFQCVPKDPEPTCYSDNDCGKGQYCAIQECSTCACAPGYECDCMNTCWGTCQPSEPDPTQCVSDYDCNGNQYCQIDACPPCWYGAECPPCNGHCVDNVPQPQECMSDADCGDGLVCQIEMCTGCACASGDSDCDCAEPVCTGTCQKPLPEPVPCDTDSECGDGQVCEMFCSKQACWDGWCPPCTGTCVDSQEPPPPSQCQVSGCSGEVCSEEPMVSICIWDPAYECLAYTKCGNFAPDGGCGWDQNDAYQACLDKVYSDPAMP